MKSNKTLEKQRLEAEMKGYQVLPYTPPDENSRLQDRLQMVKLAFEDALGEFKVFKDEVELTSGAVPTPRGTYEVEYQLEGFVPDYYLWPLDTFTAVAKKLTTLGMGDISIGLRGKGKTYHKTVDAITEATWEDKVSKDAPIMDGLKKVKYIEVSPVLEVHVSDQRFCVQEDKDE